MVKELKLSITSRVDVVVCLDACFTQKRQAPARGNFCDPLVTHPRSAFLTEGEIEEAQKLVEDTCPPPPVRGAC